MEGTLASNQTSNKRKHLEVPTKVNRVDFQVFCLLHSNDPTYSDPRNLSIGRLPVKLFGSKSYINIVKEVNQFITSRFEINFYKSKEVSEHTAARTC